jgi:hypothetical protein
LKKSEREIKTLECTVKRCEEGALPTMTSVVSVRSNLNDHEYQAPWQIGSTVITYLERLAGGGPSDTLKLRGLFEGCLKISSMVFCLSDGLDGAAAGRMVGVVCAGTSKRFGNRGALDGRVRESSARTSRN